MPTFGNVFLVSLVRGTEREDVDAVKESEDLEELKI